MKSLEYMSSPFDLHLVSHHDEVIYFVCLFCKFMLQEKLKYHFEVQQVFRPFLSCIVRTCVLGHCPVGRRTFSFSLGYLWLVRVDEKLNGGKNRDMVVRTEAKLFNLGFIRPEDLFFSSHGPLGAFCAKSKMLSLEISPFNTQNLWRSARVTLRPLITKILLLWLLTIPHLFPLRITKTSLLLGMLSTAEISLQPSSDMCPDTVLSLISTRSSFLPHGLAFAWNALSAVSL